MPLSTISKRFYGEVCRKSASVADFERLQRKIMRQTHCVLRAMVDGTGAPEFKMKYTVYRVKKGFRVVGEITQDLDLFRMPLS